jgi:tetratricopeptide (TPR) repeat protein
LLQRTKVSEAALVFDELASAGDLQGLYGYAWTAFKKGNHDQAGFYVDYIASEAEGNLKAAAFYLQGQLDFVVGNFQQSRGRFRDALRQYTKTENAEGVFRTTLRFVEVSLLVGDPQSAHALLKQLEGEQQGNQGYYYYLSSRAHFSMDEIEKARELIEHSLEAFYQEGDIGGQANALAEWGWQEILKGDFDLGLELTEKALSFAGTPKQEAYFLVNMILYRRCMNEGFEDVVEQIDALMRNSNDKLLESYIDNAVELECRRVE